MLQRPRLLLSPWRDAGDERVRVIRDGQTLQPLGGVRWQRRRYFWQPRGVLAVYETDDAALLMTLRPSRVTRGVWCVDDCDGNALGRLRHGDLLDPWGEPFARRHALGEASWVVRELDGMEYATCTGRGDADDEIAFPSESVTNPFLRMIVFGSLLLLRPEPTPAVDVAGRGR